MPADLKQLKKLRDETQASIADVKKALEESGGDSKKALEWLKKRGAEIAEKKSTRETSQGLIDAYVHQNGSVGAMVQVLCETDFVARTQEFKELTHELAMQVAAMDPKDVDALLKQDYIREPSVKIADLIKRYIGRLGENIVVKDLHRFKL